jgi:hypothetical protein
MEYTKLINTVMFNLILLLRLLLWFMNENIGLLVVLVDKPLLSTWLININIPTP